MEYKPIKCQGKDAMSFSEHEEWSRGVLVESMPPSAKPAISGIFSEGRIWVHSIFSPRRGDAKRMLSELVEHFKCNQITITPLITNNVAARFKGKVKVCPANAKDNPFGEDFECFEMTWGIGL